MKDALSVLLIDEQPDRADEIAAPLRAAGFTPEIACAPNLETALRVLGQEAVEIIIYRHDDLLDCALLSPLMAASADLPVVVVAEAVDAASLTELVSSGRFDWVIAHHLDDQLALAVERLLSSARARERERQAQLIYDANELRYRLLVDAMHDGVVAIDEHGTITFANPAIADMLELSVDELVGMNLRELLSTEDARRVAETLRATAAKEAAGPVTHELSTTTSSGQTLSFTITATPFENGPGQRPGALGIIHNLTAEHERQQELRSIRLALDNADDAVLITDVGRRVVYVNPAFERLFGPTSLGTDLTAEGADSLPDPDFFIRTLAPLEAVGALVTELDTRSVNGRSFSALVRANVVTDAEGDATGIVAVISDISALYEREQRLELVNQINAMLNSGASAEEIIASAGDGLLALLDAELVLVTLRPDPVKDPDLLFVQYLAAQPELLAEIESGFGRPERGPDMRVVPGSAAARILDEGAEVELCGIDEVGDFLAGMPAVDHPDFDAFALDLARTHDLGYVFVVPLAIGDDIAGQVLVARHTTSPLSPEEKTFVRGLAHQLAVAIKKVRTERELVRANQFLRGVLDDVGIWFSVIDENREVVIWNRAAEEISGYALEEFSDLDEILEALFPDPELRQDLYDRAQRVYDGERGAATFEAPIRCKDGETRTIAWSLHVLSAPSPNGGGGLIIVGRDVTESRILQERLLRSQRLEAIGTLAGGIAHDFNNVLTAITGYTDLLLAEMPEGSAAQHYALQVSEAARRGTTLTRQLLAFARRQPAHPQVVDLGQVVREMEELLSRLLRQNIELRLQLASDLALTVIDPSQAEQILMNLVVNARDAMPEGGQITIATDVARVDEQTAALFDARPGEYVVLMVSDTGIGMDAETEAHIFEPFFTTKAEAGNTGLGLATVYGIVRQNGGIINVYSELGKGTTVKVYLPRVGASARKEELGPSVVPATGGPETILLVEDTENLRVLIETMLGRLGYTVLAASGGAEALALAEEHADAIDLVIADVVMPDMSGTQLGDRLLQRYPDLRVLYISGYPNEHAITAGQSDPRLSFLQKPFSTSELARKVREMLDARSSPAS